MFISTFVSSLSLFAMVMPIVKTSADTSSESSSSACTLDCQNNGTCTKQWQTAARSTSKFVQVMACSCPDGFTGPLCEETTSDENNQTTEECTLDCVNGGDCIWEWTSADSGSYSFEKHMKCDCLEGFLGDLCEETSTSLPGSNATSVECNKDCGMNGQCVIEWSSDSRGSHQFTPSEVCKCDAGYEGELCQYEKKMEAATPCSHTCHNGGQCVSKWETAPLSNDALVQVSGCECAPGFTGPSCEIELSDDESEENKCHLECLNGGQCVFTWMETGTHNTNYFNSVYLSSFMMCECPTGFMGLHCEYQVESCPDSTMCFNGGKCVQQEESASYTCDCSDATNHEGDMCEQQSKGEAEICDYGHVGHIQSLFCVNGGKCDTSISQEDSDSYHHGCKCPDGFFGHHCEFRFEDTIVARETTEAVHSPRIASSSPLNGVEITLIVVFSVASTLLLVGLVSTRLFIYHDSNSAKKSGSETATGFVPSSVIGELDADGSSTLQPSKTENVSPSSEVSPSSANIQIV